RATLGVSGMGLFSARFAAPSRPGGPNFFRTQPHLRRWLLYARAARSFSKEGRRGRARTNFFRERITLLAYAAVARTDARTNVLARFLCRRRNMLRWGVIFLVIALVAALCGFTGLAATAAGIAKFLFFLFLVLCLIFLIIDN